MRASIDRAIKGLGVQELNLVCDCKARINFAPFYGWQEFSGSLTCTNCHRKHTKKAMMEKVK